MYGIESSFMEICRIPIVINNLESGNLFFHELMPDEMYEHKEATKEVQQSHEKMIEEDPSQYIARLKINSSSEQEIQYKKAISRRAAFFINPTLHLLAQS